MSSKNDKELNDMMDRLQNMGKTLEGLQSGMEKKVNSIKNPLSSIGDLTKSIKDLKDIAATTSAMSDSIEEEEDYNDIEDTLNTIWDMIDDTPNNMMLGKKIRRFYHELKEATPDPLERVANTMKDKPTYIYESPDGGNTVYKREQGTDESVLVKDGEQLHIFEENPDQLNLFTDTE
tara:strand:- start:16 stop:546 length:531 start_codon:yes stop_codon:yes gene_type:complete